MLRHKKSRSLGKRIGKYKAKEAKELSEYVKANKNRIKTRHDEIQASKSVTDIIKRVGEIIIGPKHEQKI